MSPLATIKNTRGSTAILLVLMIAGIAGIVMNIQSTIARRKAKAFHKGYKELVLETITKSSFAILESALQRRLWEPPPDSTCLRSNDTTVTINAPNGATVVVSGEFNADTKIFLLTSKGSLNGEEITYQKTIKVFDASDFLIYSKGSQSTRLGRTGNPNSTAGLVAGHRKIYSEGALIMDNRVRPTTQANLWTNQSVLPDHQRYGMVIQGERIEIFGGIRYNLNANVQDVTGPTATYNALSSARATGRPLKAFSGDGAAVFTRDYNIARSILDATTANSPGLMPSPAEYLPNVYPKALFCGTSPLMAFQGADTGCYSPASNQYYTLTTLDSDSIGWVSNFFCLSENNRNCSDSRQFPRGFENWRRNAGLDNILFTEDSSKIDLNKLSWDNLEALKEDAQSCGYYISSPQPGAYSDCDISDRAFLRNYASTGVVPSCDNFSPIDTNSFSSRFSSFSPAVYQNPSNRDRWLRRVVFSETSIEISQTSSSGLWPSLTNQAARENVPLWIVTPKVVRLKPYQQDNTSPLTSDPGRLRSLHFNKPSSGAQASLKMVIVSPEALDVVSPHHVPFTPTQITDTYPVVGGRIIPRRHSYTDYTHHEDDGYTYGARSLNFKNIIFISNSNLPTEVNLRGLWSFSINGSTRYIDSCMIADANGAPIEANIDDFSLPDYASAPNAVVPPPASKYYDKSNPANPRMSRYPYVFNLQKRTSDISRSEVEFEGIRILTGFDPETPAGKRDLSSPEKERDYRLYLGETHVDLSQRFYTWNGTTNYMPVTNLPCTHGNVRRLNGALEPEAVFSFNESQFLFTQKPVDNSLSNAGNFSSVELLMTKTR